MTSILMTDAKRRTLLRFLSLIAAPSPPVGPMKILEVTYKKVVLKWRPPVRDGGAPISSYEIYMKSADSDEWSHVTTSENMTDLTFAISDAFETFGSYLFRVTAKNLVGESSPLETTSVITIPARLLGPPGQPVGPLSVLPKTMTSISIHWQPSDDDGGSEIIAYHVAIREEQRTTWLEVAQVDSDMTEALVKDLDQGAIYHVRVMARNALGTSEPLQTQTPIKLERPPSLLTPPSSCRPPLKIVNIIADAVTLQWNAPDDDGGSPSKHWDEIETLPEFVSEYTVSKLKPNCRYLFRVNAINALGVGESMQTKEPLLIKKLKDKPGIPGQPVVTELTSENVTIVWTAPESDGGMPIGNYVVEKKDITLDKNWVIVSKQVLRSPPFTIESLNAATTYVFRVSAENELGIGFPSPASEPIALPESEIEPLEPSFEQSLIEKVTVKEKDEVKLAVKVDGRPMPEVKWYKNGKELFDGKRVRIEHYGNTSVLTITEMRGDDEGEYLVTASNKKGSVAIPKIKVPESYKDLLLFDKDEKVKLRLNFTGKPQPEVRWTKNHSEISDDRIMVETIDTNVAVLMIPNASRSDSGRYTLTVWNEFGEDSVDVNVKVSDSPSVPGKVEILPLTDSSDAFQLNWQPPLEDGGSALTYTIEICSNENLPENQFVKLTDWRQTFYTFTQTFPGMMVKFRVKASNIFGTSEPGEESEVLKVPLLEEIVQKQISPGKPDEVETPKVGELVVESEQPKVEKKETVDYDSMVLQDVPIERKVRDVNRLPNNFFDKYLLCEELGRGSYGVVYRAVEIASGRNYAAKCVHVKPGVSKDAVLHEIAIMNQLDHEKILSLHEAFDMDNEVILIEELVTGGELFDRVADENYEVTEDEVKHYIRQILQAVQHMHRRQIVHLDLKPENILLTSSTSTNIKLIDFGLACKLDINHPVRLLFGTPEFCAPEVVDYKPVSYSTDMWTVGVLSYVLLSGISPFLDETDEETLANVASGEYDFDEPNWSDVSDKAKDFVCRLMMKDKRKRMTVQEALSHPWLMDQIILTPSQQIPLRIRREFFAKRRWSDELLPIGRLAKRAAIFRQLSMDGVFEREIKFELPDYPPRVLKQLKDIVANLGDLLTILECEIEGAPTPSVQWVKDGSPISDADKFDVQYTDNTACLSIYYLETSDAGLYTCIAENNLGKTETHALLEIAGFERPVSIEPVEIETMKFAGPISKEKPEFSKFLTDQKVKLGEDVTLTVQIKEKHPSPSIVWFKNDEPIDLNDTKYS
uniref:Uncharacterized protein n=1 Tax=Romanomermis culicivorax TaxID=13658 RepID=A0A915JT26_ROMCU